MEDGFGVIGKAIADAAPGSWNVVLQRMPDIPMTRHYRKCGLAGEKMNRIIYMAKAAVLFLLALAPVSAWASSGYFYDAFGSVTVTIGNNPPHPAQQNDTVISGMLIRTGDNSHAVLKFEDGEVIGMQANSTLLVREYIYVPQQVNQSNMVFSMFKGGMRFVSGLIGQLNPKGFRLAAPQATIGIRGTDFFAVLTNDGLYSQVSSGSISLTNAAGMSVFKAGDTALTASSKVLPVQVPPIAVHAETFSQIAAIPIPAAVPGPIPMPAPVVTTESALPLAAVPAEDGLVAGAAIDTTAGGAATGGAEAAATTATAETGVTSTAIIVGVGVAVGVAALVNTHSTTHH